MLIQAEYWVMELFTLWKQTGDEWFRYIGAERYCDIETEKLDLEKVLYWSKIAEEAAQKLEATGRLLASVFWQRGRIYLKVGNFTEAEVNLMQALQLDTELGFKRYIAYSKEHLAYIYAQTGRIGLAREFAEEAKDTYERLGMSGWLRHIDTLLLHLLK